jgi:hypothetical protein
MAHLKKKFRRLILVHAFLPFETSKTLHAPTNSKNCDQAGPLMFEHGPNTPPHHKTLIPCLLRRSIRIDDPRKRRIVGIVDCRRIWPSAPAIACHFGSGWHKRDSPFTAPSSPRATRSDYRARRPVRHYHVRLGGDTSSKNADPARYRRTADALHGTLSRSYDDLLV